MPLTLVDHPLVDVLITHLRNKDTRQASFRDCCEKLTYLLIFEATRSFATEKIPVTTPLEVTDGVAWQREITIVAILRAGIGMVRPIQKFFPHAAVGYIGLERDEATAIAHQYYCKLPNLENRSVLIVDPMLGTGGSAMQAIEICRQHGAMDITLINMFAAPEGIETIEKKYPAIPIYAAVLDRELNAHKYLIPGVGDFGDRLFDT